MNAPSTTTRSLAWRHGKLALAWAVFIAYGSLVPLDYRAQPDPWQAFLSTPWLELGVGSRADWVANILLYLVLAYFATGAVWAARLGRASRLALLGLVLAACLALAVGIEFLQLFFPPRTVSRNDLLAEGLGTALGAALWFASGRRIGSMWERFVGGGTHAVHALLALYAIAYLAISFFPYDFLVTAQELATKLGRPDSLSLGPALSCGPVFGCSVRLLAEAVLTMPFGVLIVLAAGASGGRARPPAIAQGLLLGAAIGLIVEAVQLVLASGISQGISVLTRSLGVAWGVALAHSRPARWLQLEPAALRRQLLIAAPFHLLLVLALNDLLPLQLQPAWAAGEKLGELRFLPFYYHYYTSETAAVRSLLFVAGSYAPLGAAAALAWPARARWACVALAVGLCLAIELLKLFSLGKRPDPTNLLIAAAAAWLLHWITLQLRSFALRHASAPAQAHGTGRRHRPARHRFALGAGLPVLLILVTAGLTQPASLPPPAGGLPAGTYPPPAALPVPPLPHFVEAHPRLPHPSPADIARLAAQNPGYLQAREGRARGGEGALEDVIFMALTRPGSQDITALHRRLLAIRFADRGDTQVRPLALAYDWLHPQWTAAERIALQDKLAEGCDYLIDVIRKQQFSPYNAFLYNAPLQALMACSIALHREHPRGEAFMAFTHELWKNRVLPVWRQVFGRNGGWHEGGEYVAVGIGQAVYSLPAMWRAATGEDIFPAEPGLRGFLDFLVYRTRPDGTQMRWGDGAWFVRHPADALPLALEYRHAAAYSLAPPADDPTPTGWPWGPLSDPALNDPSALARLPLSRLFDGIGLLIARSDWSADATWVSFKAGDNYWSHSHLDQGAFTIYKGGPLAIDSGWYGPAYGSEHHLNYAYQSIAHNLVTVTDPADTQPGPGFDAATPRHYANDGGQRRIGSGWGVEGAPLDVEQWQQRRDTYHTGRIVRHLAADALSVAVADLTPAYTNRASGRGSFAHRTRRVERMWRVFGYDHVNDAVIVFDDVVATDAAFRKRWLLHALQAPIVGGDRFELQVPASSQAGRSGGRLLGHVLLPRDAVLHTIGGPGFEFFVDDRNYDEGGRVQQAIRQLGHGRAEPGAWRIELMPARAAEADEFLVVMLPRLAGDAPPTTIRRLEQDGRVGAEIAGPRRTTRWWFTPGQLGATVEVVEDGEQRTHSLNE